ncbi:DUF2199 domain-containing protein [Undibacterium sp.]|uniref:DUF2199 domain-containing protein n=1 Tax=Undibacterium sp. TaxID=1914977 RepID=UPI0025E3AF14|nr:DUF2199 domain-containing protein [Undibacterium sp.]
MSEDFVTCSCCGKLVPASNIELSFRRPDEIAALEEPDINERCKFNDDIYVLDEQRFFIRCTLPLPVHESADHYAIGAWAEIGQTDFTRIWDLWEDENQSNLPAICGTLANKVPLTMGSINCAIEVKLTGPTTRPEIKVLDELCSLYKEQTFGVTAHRASEYSGLVRR